MDLNKERSGRAVPPFYCWVVLLLAGFASFFTFFHRMSAGVLRADLVEEFALSATSFAAFSSVCFYPYMLMQIPVGLLADRWGVRKTVSLGCLVTALGTLLLASAGSFAAACLGRLLVGFGISAPVVCTQKAAAVWFPENKVAGGYDWQSGRIVRADSSGASDWISGMESVFLFCRSSNVFICFALRCISSGQSRRIVGGNKREKGRGPGCGRTAASDFKRNLSEFQAAACDGSYVCSDGNLSDVQRYMEHFLAQ